MSRKSSVLVMALLFCAIATTVPGVSVSSVDGNHLQQRTLGGVHTPPWLGVNLYATTIKEMSVNVFEVTFMVQVFTLTNTTINYSNKDNGHTGVYVYTDPEFLRPSTEGMLFADDQYFIDVVTFDISLPSQTTLMENLYSFSGYILVFVTTDNRTGLTPSVIDFGYNLPQFTTNLGGGYRYAYMANESMFFEIDNNVSPWALLGGVGPFVTTIPVFFALSFTKPIQVNPVVIVTAVSTSGGFIAMVKFRKEKELISMNISTFITMWVAYPYFADNIIEKVLVLVTCSVVLICTLLYLAGRGKQVNDVRVTYTESTTRKDTDVRGTHEVTGETSKTAKKAKTAKKR